MTSSLHAIVQVLLLAILAVPLLNIAALSALAALRRTRHDFTALKSRRFVIIIPAHNEEGFISRTIQSLRDVDYPRERFELLVIADNCSDRTAPVSRALGCEVLERKDPKLRGKGYALRWCFDFLIEQGRAFDAVVVVDADSVVSSNMLKVLNYYLENGSKALQCSDLAEGVPGVWNVESIRLGFFLHNYVRPLGRSVFGGHVGAMGNGMCFSREAILKVPWNAFSLAEDLEYGLMLLVEGYVVEFAPEAVVLATMPSNPKHSESQRSRWEMSRFPLIERYFWLLLKAAWEQRSYKPLDALLDLVTPPFVNLTAIALLGAIVSFALSAAFGTSPAYGLFWCVLGFLGLFHVLIGLLIANDPTLWKSLFHVPRYAVWKALLYMKIVRRGHTQEWVRTSREN